MAETGVVSGITALVLGRVIDPPDSLVVQHLFDEGFACVVRADHSEVGSSITGNQFERLKHVNVVPPGRMRAGLFQALAWQQLKREVAISVTNFFAVAEMVALTDDCAMLPSLVCPRLAHDRRLEVLSPPVDLGTFPVELAWHVRYRHDPAHRWLRSVIAEVASDLAGALFSSEANGSLQTAPSSQSPFRQPVAARQHGTLCVRVGAASGMAQSRL